MIIAVDFDGTCVDHQYPGIGKDAPEVVRVLKALDRRGHQLMLWTVRDEADPNGPVLEDAVSWFEHNDITLWGVNLNPEQGWTKAIKQNADIYIDDRALGVPLIKPKGFRGAVVDWVKIEEWFVERGLL